MINVLQMECNSMRVLISFFTLFAFHIATTAASEIGEDGLHKQPWFTTSFRDMAEDMQAAQDSGKRLAIIFEQRGCIYCKKLHETVFSDPGVRKFISENYMMVQYNLFGDEEVIDLDGETLTEKKAARKWRVVYTPTIMFMPDQAKGDQDTGRSAASIMPGAFGKGTTLSMFKWVREKGYVGDEHFQKYHAPRITERKSGGN
jgi:thioredoxin-related protein